MSEVPGLVHGPGVQCQPPAWGAQPLSVSLSHTPSLRHIHGLCPREFFKPPNVHQKISLIDVKAVRSQALWVPA